MNSASRYTSLRPIEKPCEGERFGSDVPLDFALLGPLHNCAWFHLEVVGGFGCC
jgi:hypothetical protein